MSGNETPPRAAILGCSGQVLTDAERRFYADCDPLGFILFGRNVASPEQLKTLTAALRDSVGRADAPVLIDQEGGRVRRLRPPHWREAQSMRPFGDLYARDPEAGKRALALNTALLAQELLEIGIDVDCAPVLDVPAPNSHDIVGDRAFSADPETVSVLGRVVTETFLACGVMPVIKHTPGHGRSVADSHRALPVVSATLDELDATDFVPFRALADAPLAMTAHIIYAAIDPDLPATLSPTVIGDIIRRHIGFDGLLLSDDLSMHALSGPFDRRAAQSLEAGCDIVLHCNGDPEEMAAVMSVVPYMNDIGLERWQRAQARRLAAGAGTIPADADRELTRLFA